MVICTLQSAGDFTYATAVHSPFCRVVHADSTNLRASKRQRESAKVCRSLQFESYSATPVEVASHLQSDSLFNGVKNDTPQDATDSGRDNSQDVTTYNS